MIQWDSNIYFFELINIKQINEKYNCYSKLQEEPTENEVIIKRHLKMWDNDDENNWDM